MTPAVNTLFPGCDYHIHTVYSGHSTPDMTVRNIIKRAEVIGLESIVVLEHAFYSDMGRAGLEQIRKEVSAVETPIKVLIGMEIDPDYSRKGRLAFEDFEREEIDAVLVGTHAIPGTGKGWHAKLELTRKERERIYRAWFETVESLLENSRIDIIAHPGRLISRNGIVEEFSGQVMKDFERLFASARRRNAAVELNESLLKLLHGEARLQSYTEVIRLAMSMELKISPGSDAHSLDRIGENHLILRVAEQLRLSPEHLFRLPRD